MKIGSERVCRTCLRFDNLAPIFQRTDLHERYTLALFLTTGLQIEMDDGLPQTICNYCMKLINTAIDFRNQSHKSERQLLRWGHRRKVEPSCYDLDHTDSINIKQETYEQDHAIKSESLTPRFGEFNVEHRTKEVKLEKDDWSSANLDSPDEELPTSVTVPELSKKSNNIKIDERCQNLTSENLDLPDEELPTSVTVPELSKKSNNIKIDERYQNLTSENSDLPDEELPTSLTVPELSKKSNNIKIDEKYQNLTSENLDLPDQELPTSLTVPELSKKSNNIKIDERYQNLTSENLDSPDEELPTSVTVPELSKKSINIKIDESYQNLTDHPIRGPGPYNCKACKMILKNWATFKMHAKLHLGFDLLCEYCGKKFKAITVLKLHLMIHHGAKRTFRCWLCDHGAVDKERLQVHVRRVHTGDRPYVCDTCGASFFKRCTLVHHLDVHLTEKTVKCPLCPAKFKSGQQLNNHTTQVHRQQGWRVECYLCDNTYSRGIVVRKHLAKVHGVPVQKQAALRRVQPTLTIHA